MFVDSVAVAPFYFDSDNAFNSFRFFHYTLHTHPHAYMHACVGFIVVCCPILRMLYSPTSCFKHHTTIKWHGDSLTVQNAERQHVAPKSYEIERFSQRPEPFHWRADHVNSCVRCVFGLGLSVVGSVMFYSIYYSHCSSAASSGRKCLCMLSFHLYALFSQCPRDEKTHLPTHP